jgi:hypothetical protein
MKSKYNKEEVITLEFLLHQVYMAEQAEREMKNKKEKTKKNIIDFN